MKVFIDADGFPFVEDIIELTERYEIECIIVHDYSHTIAVDSQKQNCKCIVVDQGKNATDYTIYLMINSNDIVLTNDAAFATMCCAKGAIVLDKEGFVYKDSFSFNKLHILSPFNKLSKRTSQKRTNLITKLKQTLEILGFIDMDEKHKEEELEQALQKLLKKYERK